jgi:hypothetical protein
MNRVRDIRSGKDYDSSFGKRMRGEGIWADLIRQRFDKTVKRLGLSAHSRRFKGLDSSRFRPPSIIPSVGPVAVQSPMSEKSKGSTGKQKRESENQTISLSFSDGILSRLTVGELRSTYLYSRAKPGLLFHCHGRRSDYARQYIYRSAELTYFPKPVYFLFVSP